MDTTDGAYHFDRLAVTLPTRLFLRLARGLPDAYRARWEQGPLHLGAHCVVLALDRPLMPPVYWLSVTDPGYPFLAAVEHTNFLPASDYGGRHLLYLGNYLPMDHALFRWDDERVLAEFLPHLRKLNPAFDPAWVQEHWVWQAPYAQPVVTRGYLRQLPPHETPLGGVSADVAHVYPQDRGQNYSFRLGERLAARLRRLAHTRVAQRSTASRDTAPILWTRPSRQWPTTWPVHRHKDAPLAWASGGVVRAVRTSGSAAASSLFRRGRRSRSALRRAGSRPRGRPRRT